MKLSQFPPCIEPLPLLTCRHRVASSIPTTWTLSICSTLSEWTQYTNPSSPLQWTYMCGCSWSCHPAIHTPLPDPRGTQFMIQWTWSPKSMNTQQLLLSIYGWIHRVCGKQEGFGWRVRHQGRKAWVGLWCRKGMNWHTSGWYSGTWRLCRGWEYRELGQ